MNLITEAQQLLLLANGHAARDCMHVGLDIDPLPVVKLFAPGSSNRWLLTEIDPLHTDRAYGLYYNDCGLPDLGYVNLRELERLRVGVESDPNFVADKPISAYAADAYMRGVIRA
jgi:Protein of unknown function (DUF2958)